MNTIGTDFNKKIAVIGAGPAGITAALELRDKGFEDITIIGLFNEAQVKTLHVDGVTIDVAACFHHWGYKRTLLPLAERFDVGVAYFDDGPTMIKPDLEEVQVRPIDQFKSVCAFSYSSIFFMLWLLFYNSKWQRVFNIRMGTFFKSIGAGFLLKSNMVSLFVTAQGYGDINEVTAYHNYRWFRPSLIPTIALNYWGKGAGSLSNGFQTLFRRILDQFPYRHQKVKKISLLKEGSKKELTLENNDKQVFDTVVIACPLDKIDFPAQDLLEEGDIEHTMIFSYLFSSHTFKDYRNCAYINEFLKPKVEDKIYGIRYAGQTKSGKHVYWGVGSKAAETSESELKVEIKRQILEEFKMSIAEEHYYKVFPYNLRFSEQAIEKGLPFQLKQLQGKNNIWYSGGLMSHWDVSSIIEHNRWMVNKIVYQNSHKRLKDFTSYYWNGIKSRVRMM